MPSSSRSGHGFTDDDVLDTLRARRSTVSAQLDALDQLIEAVERARQTGALESRVVVDGSKLAKVVATRMPAAIKVRKVRQLRQPRQAPDDAPPVSAPVTFGFYDQKILAHLKLAAGDLGCTAKDVVKGVAGKKGDDPGTYQVVWCALKALAKRGLIRKDGRHYFPAEPVAA